MAFKPTLKNTKPVSKVQPTAPTEALLETPEAAEVRLDAHREAHPNAIAVTLEVSCGHSIVRIDH